MHQHFYNNLSLDVRKPYEDNRYLKQNPNIMFHVKHYITDYYR